jgi:DNA (cytosine-5)-methyltransferase 1
MSFAFIEFFAGGGMARLGLGDRFECVFANDFDPAKGRAYAANFGSEHLSVCDIAALTVADLPGCADMAWASPPCVGFSEAGNRGGMADPRSNCFHAFLKLIEGLNAEGRAPRLVVIENVAALTTSRSGADFAHVRSRLEAAGYDAATAIIDAQYFVPQSRERVFVLAARDRPDIGSFVEGALKRLPQRPDFGLEDMIDEGAAWDEPAKTSYRISLLNIGNRLKLDGARRRAQASFNPVYGAGYRRMRSEGGDTRTQRLEVRFDDLAGAIRTGKGGSSRQIVLRANPDGSVQSRLMAPREAARLMGLLESYVLPESVVEAIDLAGDGVVVPVVRWLAEHVFEPILAAAEDQSCLKAAE